MTGPAATPAYLLYEHLYMTLRRVAGRCVVIGVVVGVALGLLDGFGRMAPQRARPVADVPPARPAARWRYFFLLVIWLGIDEAPTRSRCLRWRRALPTPVATTAAVRRPHPSDCRRRPRGAEGQSRAQVIP